MAEAKSNPSYSLDLHFLGIIMGLDIFRAYSIIVCSCLGFNALLALPSKEALKALDLRREQSIASMKQNYLGKK